MSGVRQEVFLNCPPEEAFGEFADPGFPRKIGFGSGEIEVLYRDARLVHFKTTVAGNGNINCMESERILAPESLTIVTVRRNLAAFRYNVMVDCFAAHESGTRFIHVDEFQPATETAPAEAIVRGMRDATALFMDKVRDYFAAPGRGRTN